MSNNTLGKQTRTIAKKTSKAELNRRVAIVQEMIAKKMRESEIIEHILQSQSDWKVKPQTVRVYIKRAKEDLVRQLRRHSAAMIAESLMDLNYLYKKALDDDDLKTALAVRKEKNNLLALYGMTAQGDEKEDHRQTDSEIDAMLRDVTVSQNTLGAS